MTVELVNITTKGTKEIHEVGLCFKAVMTETKKALADGWQPGTDMPAILVGSIGSLTTAIAGANGIVDEGKEEPVKATMGALIPIAEGIDELVVKRDVAV